MYTVMITGHRPNRLYGYDILSAAWEPLGRAMSNELVSCLTQHPEGITAMTGMALGTDQLFGLQALQLRKAYPIRVVACIPCSGHTSHWKDATHWWYIKNNADDVVYVSKDPYTPWCMHMRDRYMVDRSDAVLAVYKGIVGGTRNCIKYALTKGLPVKNLLAYDINS